MAWNCMGTTLLATRRWVSPGVMMAVPLRILLAEDSADSAEGVAIVLQALRRAGYEPTAMRVDDSPLGRQRDFLRLLLDTHPDLIFVKDSCGRFTMANLAVAELYGTTVDQLMGKCESDVNPRAEETLRSATAEQDMIASGRPMSVSTEPMTDLRTGSTRWFDVRRVPLAVPGETGCQVLVTAVETTDRRIAESALRAADVQLRQAQKMEAIGQLAGGVAHDFNNLLTAILGYTALLIESTRDQPELAADLLEIKKAGERAGSLTRQLLTFSRKQVVQLALLDLNQVIGDLEKVIGQVLGDEVELETIKASALSQVRADPNQIEQILVNLAANARDAMPVGGVLRIETKCEVLRGRPARPCRRALAVAVRDDDRLRHGDGNTGGDYRPRVRALLHNQGARQGNRSWSVDGVRHRESEWRGDQRGERA